MAQDRLRFDFTWDKPLTPDELCRIEELVNSAIAADIPVDVQERPASDIDVFKPVTLLGEDYGEHPRFVLVGENGWEDPSKRFSLELCGGTHVRRTGVIRHFKIRKETSVAAGIRRIEAVAGPAYEEHERLEDQKARQDLREALVRYLQITAEIMAMTGKPFKAVPRRLPDPDVAPVQDIKRALDALKELEKMLRAELANLKQAALAQQAHLGKVFLDVGGFKLSVQKFREAELTTLRAIADDAKRELGTGVVLLGSTDENKLSFVVGVTQDLTGKGVDALALALARAIAVEIGGRAGGRSDFAQGGGPDTDWELVVRKVTDKLRTM